MGRHLDPIQLETRYVLPAALYVHLCNQVYRTQSNLLRYFSNFFEYQTISRSKLYILQMTLLNTYIVYFFNSTSYVMLFERVVLK